MKFITILNNAQAPSRSLKSTNEGFISDIIDIFKPGKKKLSDKEIYDMTYSREYERLVSEYLDSSLRDNRWCEKNLTNNSVTIPSHIAFIDGKNNPSFAPLMTSLIQAKTEAMKVISNFKSNIQLRKKLCNQISRLGEDEYEKADKLYEANKNKLISNLPLEYAKSGGKLISCVGMKKGTTFPISREDLPSFTTYYDDAPEGCELAGPNIQNKDNYLKAIENLLIIIKEAYSVVSDNYIPYWDICSIDYDDLEYGDEIIDEIFNNQHNCPTEPLQTFGHMARRLLIDMLRAI